MKHTTSDIIIIIGITFIILFSALILIFKYLINSKNTSNLNNEFQTIDTNIKPSRGQYSYENVTNNFQTYFKSNPLVSNAIKFSNQFASLTFFTSPNQGFATANFKEKPDVNSNSIIFPKVFPNIDLKYSIDTTRLLEEFIVANKETALNVNKILQNVETSGIDRYQEIDGKIDFYHQNTRAFTVPKAVMYEANSPANTSYGIKYEITQTSANKYSINKVITDEGKKWLNDNNRSYPIVIDLVIDNADVVGNWATSDSTNAAITQDTVIK